MKRNASIGAVALLVYGVCVFLANWLILNWGPIVLPGGTHLIPVGFGLAAPSGTIAAASVLVARDVVQRTIGRKWSLLVIVPGVALTALLSPALAAASATAFLFGEAMDYAVYTPLQRKHFVMAVFASGCVGSVVDSFVFLHIAGIPLALALPGLLLCRLYVMVGGGLVAAGLRRYLSVHAVS